MTFYMLTALILCLSWFVKIAILQRLTPLEIGRKVLLLFTCGAVLLETALPNWGRVIEPVLLLSVLIYLRPAWKLKQYLFYGLFPFVMVDMVERSIGSAALRVPETIINIAGDWQLEIGGFLILALLAPLFLFILFVKVFRIDIEGIARIFSYPQFTKIIWLFDISLVLYAFVAYPYFVFQGLQVHSTIHFQLGHSELAIDMIGNQMIVFLIFTLYVNFKMRDILDKEVQELREQQLDDLASYSQQVESLYEELRSFRHDYTNVLVSLNESIKTRDIRQVEEVYQTVLKDSDRSFYQSKYELPELSHLKDASMKSIVSAKLIQALELGIEVSVEIPEEIDRPSIDALDFIKILSIFLDNALEAAQEADSPSLTFAYFTIGNDKILVLENTTKEDKVATKSIFQEGYSSKGNDRGIGLANVRKITQKYPRLSLQTTSSNYRFKQEMVFH